MILTEIDSYKVVSLDKDFAKLYLASLVLLFNQIPKVLYLPEDILSERKGERLFYEKWSHGIALLDGSQLIGALLAYEREGEKNEQYPENTLYISEFAILDSYQKKGLGKKLLQVFLENNRKKGFLFLQGSFTISVQTNSGNFNGHVVRLYESLGFTFRAYKQYENRKDIVLGLSF